MTLPNNLAQNVKPTCCDGFRARAERDAAIQLQLEPEDHRVEVSVGSENQVDAPAKGSQSRFHADFGQLQHEASRSVLVQQTLRSAIK